MGDPVDVGVGLIQPAEGIHVFVGDVADRPGWQEVEQVGLVDPLGIGLLFDQAPFLFEAMPEAGVGQGLQHAHHRGRNAGAADKTHDAIAGTCFFTIETNNEAGHHPDAVGGDPIDGVFQRTAGVLVLAGQGEAGLIRGFDAQKHRLKAGFGHHLHHFVVGGQIDGGFCGESEGEAALHLPLFDGRQQQLGVALVADEVVIHQEDGPAPAQVIEGL